MKNYIIAIIGILGSAITHLIGGWSTSLYVLLIMMVVDYITGLAVAAVFKASPKTESGALSSKVGFKGICKKCMIFVMVIVANQLDVLLDVEYARQAVIISFIVNELISIIENAGCMGLPIPKVFNKIIDVLKDKEGEEYEDN